MLKLNNNATTMYYKRIKKGNAKLFFENGNPVHSIDYDIAIKNPDIRSTKNYLISDFHFEGIVLKLRDAKFLKISKMKKSINLDYRCNFYDSPIVDVSQKNIETKYFKCLSQNIECDYSFTDIAAALTAKNLENFTAENSTAEKNIIIKKINEILENYNNINSRVNIRYAQIIAFELIRRKVQKSLYCACSRIALCIEM